MRIIFVRYKDYKNNYLGTKIITVQSYNKYKININIRYNNIMIMLKD